MQPGSRCQWYNSHGAATLIRPRRPLPTNPFSAKPAIAQGSPASPYSDRGPETERALNIIWSAQRPLLVGDTPTMYAQDFRRVSSSAIIPLASPT
ncbi:predicted protein [Plenodomus lingam JN3]|uniref:Predicted protein n=1 Tax=Leptosphaeria maculans (strain JN3 / isolate v23.1.3 / race Av1-4-5-6-7-8) TaxID=985895 RepID=E5AA78_LEPMJ|nr:predicted protein [Plenodomus lingam JN3]CBY00569.1 predicted protein [Plenodomus lingam JN3]